MSGHAATEKRRSGFWRSSLSSLRKSSSDGYGDQTTQHTAAAATSTHDKPIKMAHTGSSAELPGATQHVGPRAAREGCSITGTTLPAQKAPHSLQLKPVQPPDPDILRKLSGSTGSDIKEVARPTSYGKAFKVLGLDDLAKAEASLQQQELLTQTTVLTTTEAAIHPDIAKVSHASFCEAMGDDAPEDASHYRQRLQESGVRMEEVLADTTAEMDGTLLSDSEIQLLERENIFLGAGQIRIGVSVIGAHLRAEDGTIVTADRFSTLLPNKSTAEYVVRIRVGMKAWLVSRTYGDFKLLHSHIAESVATKDRDLLPLLPGRLSDITRVALFTRPDMLAARMTDLQAYLRMLTRLSECWEGEAGLHLTAFLDDPKKTLALQASFARIMRRTEEMFKSAAGDGEALVVLQKQLVQEERKAMELTRRLQCIGSLLRDQLDASGLESMDKALETSTMDTELPSAAASDASVAHGTSPALQRNKLKEAMNKQRLSKGGRGTQTVPASPQSATPGPPSLEVQRERSEFIALLGTARAVVEQRQIKREVDTSVRRQRSASSTTMEAPKSRTQLSSSVSSRKTVDMPALSEVSDAMRYSTDFSNELTMQDIDEIASVILGASSVGQVTQRAGGKSFTHSFLASLFDHSSFNASFSSRSSSIQAKPGAVMMVRSTSLTHETYRPIPHVGRKRRSASTSDLHSLRRLVNSMLDVAEGPKQNSFKPAIGHAGRVEHAAGDTALELLVRDTTQRQKDVEAIALLTRPDLPASRATVRAQVRNAVDKIVDAVGPSAESEIRRQEVCHFIVATLRSCCGIDAIPIGSFNDKTYLPDSPIELMVPLPPLLVVDSVTTSSASGHASTYDAAPMTNQGLWYAKVNEALCAVAGRAEQKAPADQPDTRDCVSENKPPYSECAISQLFMNLLPSAAQANVLKSLITSATSNIKHKTGCVHPPVGKAAMDVLRRVMSTSSAALMEAYEDEIINACTICGAMLKPNVAMMEARPVASPHEEESPSNTSHSPRPFSLDGSYTSFHGEDTHQGQHRRVASELSSNGSIDSSPVCPQSVPERREPNFQRLYECLAMASVTKALQEAANDTKNSAVHHLAALAQGFKSTEPVPLAKRTTASAEAHFVNALQESAYEARRRQLETECRTELAMPAGWLRSVDGHAITIRNISFNVIQSSEGSAPLQLHARFTKRAIVSCLVDNIRVNIYAGEQFAYSYPPTCPDAASWRTPTTLGLPIAIRTVNLAPLHNALFTDLTAAYDVADALGSVADDIAVAMKHPRKLAWNVAFHSPARTAFELDVPHAVSDDSLVSVARGIVGREGALTKPPQLPDCKLPVVAHAEVINLATSRKVTVPIDLPKLNDIFRESLIVIAGWLRYEGPVLAARTAEEIHQIANKGIPGAFPHAHIATPHIPVCEEVATNNDTFVTCKDGVSGSPDISIGAALRELKRSHRCGTSMEPQVEGSGLGELRNPQFDALTYANLQVMVAALFAAAANYAAGFRHSESWEACFPSNGSFMHSADVLACFAAVYSMIDFRKYTISALGIMDRADMPKLTQFMKLALERTATEAQLGSEWMASCIANKDGGKEAEEVSTIEGASTRRKRVDPILQSGSVAGVLHVDREDHNTDALLQAWGLSNCNMVRAEVTQQNGDACVVSTLIPEFVAQLLADYASPACRAVGATSLDTQATTPVESSWNHLEVFISDLCLPWMNASTGVSTLQLTWFQTLCATLRYQLAALLRGCIDGESLTAVNSAFGVHVYPSTMMKVNQSSLRRPDLMMHPLQQHAQHMPDSLFASADAWDILRTYGNDAIPPMWSRSSLYEQLKKTVRREVVAPVSAVPASRQARIYLALAAIGSISANMSYIDAFSHLCGYRPEALAAVTAKLVCAKGILPIGVVGQMLKYIDGGHVCSLHNLVAGKEDAHQIFDKSFGRVSGATLEASDVKLSALGDMFACCVKALFGSTKAMMQMLPSYFVLGAESSNNPCVVPAGHRERYPFLQVSAVSLAAAAAFMKRIQPLEESIHTRTLASFADLARLTLTQMDGALHTEPRKKSSNATSRSASTLQSIPESATATLKPSAAMSVPALISATLDNCKEYLTALHLPADMGSSDMNPMEKLWLSMFSYESMLLMPSIVVNSQEFRTLFAIAPVHTCRFMLSAAASAFNAVSISPVAKKSSRGSRKSSGATTPRSVAQQAPPPLNLNRAPPSGPRFHRDDRGGACTPGGRYQAVSPHSFSGDGTSDASSPVVATAPVPDMALPPAPATTVGVGVYSFVGYTPLPNGLVAAVSMAADGSTVLVPLQPQHANPALMMQYSPYPPMMAAPLPPVYAVPPPPATHYWTHGAPPDPIAADHMATSHHMHAQRDSSSMPHGSETRGGRRHYRGRYAQR